MNYKVILIMAIIPLLLIAAGGTAFGDTGDYGMHSSSNYAYSVNATTSTLTNLSYQSENGNLLLASQVVASSSDSLKVNLSALGGVHLDNATILGQVQENVFMMLSSKTGSYQNYSLNPVSNITKIKLDLGAQMSDSIDNMGMNFGSSTSFNSTVYSYIVNDTEFYLFSNGQSTLTHSTLSYHSSKYLLTGVISFGGVVKSIDHFKAYNENRFSYNNSTGSVSGEYLNFSLNASTGVISSFTDKSIPQTIFTSIYATGNGTMYSQANFPVMPMNTPMIVGSLFVYANNTTIIAMHDNPAIESNFIIDNGSLHFMLAHGLNATIVTTLGADISISADVAANLTVAGNEALGLNGNVQAGAHAVLIQGNGVRAYLLLQHATANVSGNAITINTTGFAQVSFVSPPGLQGKNLSLGNLVQKAIDNGKIAAEISISGSTSASVNVTITFNATVNTVVTSVTNGKVVLNLSAAAGHHKGTDVLIFVSNSVIASGSTIHLSFDGTVVNLTSVGGVINATSSTQASFATMKVSGGTLIILHVPHFSNHTVDIYSSSASSNPLNSIYQNADLVVLGVVIAVIVAISAVAVVRRKSKQ